MKVGKENHRPDGQKRSLRLDEFAETYSWISRFLGDQKWFSFGFSLLSWGVFQNEATRFLLPRAIVRVLIVLIAFPGIGVPGAHRDVPTILWHGVQLG